MEWTRQSWMAAAGAMALPLRSLARQPVSPALGPEKIEAHAQSLVVPLKQERGECVPFRPRLPRRQRQRDHALEYHPHGRLRLLAAMPSPHA